jgi:hypothetical protein
MLRHAVKMRSSMRSCNRWPLLALTMCLAGGCSESATAPPRDALPERTLQQLDGGCDGPAVFLYVDKSCGPAPDTSVDLPGCYEWGDGRCYERCSTDEDCVDPLRPRCRIIGLYAESDYNCTQKVSVCRKASLGNHCSP